MAFLSGCAGVCRVASLAHLLLIEEQIQQQEVNMLQIDIENLAPNFRDLNIGEASRLSNDVEFEIKSLLDDFTWNDVEEFMWVS